MKSENAGSGKTGSGLGAGPRGRVPMIIPQIPMEWMDPMSWRLPSGKALAEFALQAGFLAPLMLGTPAFKKRKKRLAAPAAPAGLNADLKADLKGVKAGVNAAVKAGIEKQAGEAPEQSGGFRGIR